MKANTVDNKGVVLVLPTSGTTAEIFLQHYEPLLIKHWIRTNTICHCTRYVDSILIIFNARKITEEIILDKMNQLHRNTEFKLKLLQKHFYKCFYVL
jgi:hypothetical protein